MSEAFVASRWTGSPGARGPPYQVLVSCVNAARFSRILIGVSTSARQGVITNALRASLHRVPPRHARVFSLRESEFYGATNDDKKTSSLRGWKGGPTFCKFVVLHAYSCPIVDRSMAKAAGSGISGGGRDLLLLLLPPRSGVPRH